MAKRKGAPKSGMKAIGNYMMEHPTEKMMGMSEERQKRYVFGGLRKTGIKKYGKVGFNKRMERGRHETSGY